jgi:macrodomain Ter protein organizer (MatP/YcbG family)
MKRYKITDTDLEPAIKWLENKLDKDLINFPSPDFNENIELNKEFREITSPDALNTWSESNLNKKQWYDLKASIRAYRLKVKRTAGDSVAIKRVVLQMQVYDELNSLANERNESLNDTVKYLLSRS